MSKRIECDFCGANIPPGIEECPFCREKLVVIDDMTEEYVEGIMSEIDTDMERMY
jgi:hypothetical protein